MIVLPLALLSVAGCLSGATPDTDDSPTESPAESPTESEVPDSEDLHCVYRWWYLDGDGDGFGFQDPALPPTSVWSCDPVDGYSPYASDCDDSNAAIFPGAIDAAGDGIDSDCDSGDG